MNSPTTEKTTRRDAGTERVVQDLIPRISQLMRLVVKHARATISRSEGGILGTLSTGPKRVTELAEIEGLAQPTITILINRLEQNGWVTRARDADDGRVVLVSLTPAGTVALEQFRAQYREVLREHLESLSDEQVEALVDSLGALDVLAASIHRGEHR
jgi:DNA-binding MarR family transcriptional regulator